MFNFDTASLGWAETLIVFFSTLVADLLWAVYIRRVSEGKSLQAATYSAFIVLLGAIAVASYVENSWYLFPAIVGAFVGTLITIEFDKRKSGKT